MWIRTLPFLFCAMLTAGGCSRTDDGTVVIPQTLDVRRADFGPLDLRHPGRMRPAEAPRPIMAAAPEPFPVSPHARSIGERRKRAGAARRYRTEAGAAPAPAAPASAVACKPAQRKGARIQVRCE